MAVLIRRTYRGEVSVDGCTYFACELADFHQQEVFVEPFNDDNVKVFDMSGALICTATREKCWVDPSPMGNWAMFKAFSRQKVASSAVQDAEELVGNVQQTVDLDDLDKPAQRNHAPQATIAAQARSRSFQAKVARKAAMIDQMLVG
ncbi:hypothetical protein BMT54_01215 [Pasteurellaceae bacterium 15-036681]|nr:hypothetical protein BMT54_01215 [Pasteurellaceae bacterium 15-036681]